MISVIYLSQIYRTYARNVRTSPITKSNRVKGLLFEICEVLLCKTLDII